MKGLATVVLVVFLAFSVLSGCGAEQAPDISKAPPVESEQPSSGVPAKDINIRVMWWGNQPRNDGTVAVLDLYREQNPGITFETEFTNWANYWDKLATQSAAGSQPDIVQQDYRYLNQYQKKGLLEPLDPYVDKGLINVSDIPQGVLGGGTIDGTLYAITLGTNALCFVYDKEITDRAGVTIRDQMTWNEFVSAAKLINQKTGAKTTLGYGIGESILVYMANMSGASMYDDSKSKFGFPDATIPTRYFQMFEDAINDGYYVPPEIFVERSPTVIEQKLIVDGTTWNDFIGSNQIVALINASGRDLEIVMNPRFDEDKTGGYLMPSMSFTISANSKYKDESAKVIDFFTNSLEANKILNAERGIPASSKIASTLKDGQTPAVKKIFDFTARIEKNIFSVNPFYAQGATEITELVNKTIEVVSYKQKTAREAGEEFFNKGNEILAKASK